MQGEATSLRAANAALEAQLKDSVAKNTELSSASHAAKQLSGQLQTMKVFAAKQKRALQALEAEKKREEAIPETFQVSNWEKNVTTPTL